MHVLFLPNLFPDFFHYLTDILTVAENDTLFLGFNPRQPFPWDFLWQCRGRLPVLSHHFLPPKSNHTLAAYWLLYLHTLLSL